MVFKGGIEKKNNFEIHFGVPFIFLQTPVPEEGFFTILSTTSDLIALKKAFFWHDFMRCIIVR